MLLGGLGVVAAAAIFVADAALCAPKHAPRKSEDGNAAVRRGCAPYGFPLLLSVGVIDSATRMAFLTFLPFVLTAKGASLPTVGLRADAGVRRRRRRQAGLRLHRRAHRRGRDRVADRSGDRARHCRAAAAAARRRAVLAAGGRRRAQRHLVGALRLGAGSGASRRGARAPSAFSTPARSAPARSRPRSTACSAMRSACRRR